MMASRTIAAKSDFQNFMGNATKQLTDDQSFETNIISDKMLAVKFSFHGKNWEDFARLIFKKLPISVIGYFVGGSVNMAEKKASIRGEFSHSAFMEKYGKLMPDWKFSVDPKKRWHMPTKGKEDVLRFSINGYDPNDLQTEVLDGA